MHAKEIQEGLNLLAPEIPWAHMIEFAPGIVSVSEENEKFYKKAYGLKKIGDVLLKVAEQQVQGHSLHGKTVLDLACGEGGHSIQFAEKGARVVGVEGRKLYLDRANFAAKVKGIETAEFIQGDVRKLDPDLGLFDVVVFSGILHHLGIDDFDAMIDSLAKHTADMLLLYTHISTDKSIKNHQLVGPKKTLRDREGYLFREHKDNATDEQKEKQVRASLDNTFSFWAKEPALIGALQQAGFSIVLKVMQPNPFGWDNASYRPIIVAKK